MGRNSARSNDDKEGKGFSKKRMPIYNGLDKGSNFALIWKDADLLMVSSCVNGNKPTNVRYSTTPLGERLTDNLLVGCCPESQNQLCKLTGAWYRKGLKTFERCEVKVSSPVPRGERRSNPPDLPDNEVRKHEQKKIMNSRIQNSYG